MSSLGIETNLLSQEATAPHGEQRNSNRVVLLCVLACSWLIAAFIFSLPDREAPTSIQGMDFVAVGKLVSRGGSLVILALANLVLIRQKTLTEILPLYLGFLLFAVWSAASVTWSCLPEVSAGQVLSFGVMLLLSFAIAQSVRTFADVKLILLSLNGMLILRAAGMVGMYMLDSSAISRESDSYFHSTEAAETAAPSLILLVGCAACIRDQRFKLLLMAGLPLYIALFVIAQNRLSLVVTPAVIGLILMSTGNRRLIVKLVFLVCLLVPAYILFDPGLELISKSVGSTEQYAMRNDDSGDTFSTFSGRTEMWAAVSEEFAKSPLRGHGYFVTSSTGELHVWGHVRNYTAHNQVLQVLATTGIIGLGLFLLAIWIPTTLLLRSLASGGERKRIAMVVGFVIMWLVCWSTLNSSFSGALGSLSITFYILLGITIGGLRDNRISSKVN